jgi:hypothetical protein
MCALASDRFGYAEWYVDGSAIGTRSETPSIADR